MLLVSSSSHPVVELKVPVHASVLIAVKSTIPPQGATAVILMQLCSAHRLLVVGTELSNDASVVAHEDIGLLDHLESNPERLLVAVEHLIADKVAFPLAVHLACAH